MSFGRYRWCRLGSQRAYAGCVVCHGDEIQVDDANSKHVLLSGDPDVGRLDVDAWLTGDI
jgi:hypothetical protein